MTALRWLGFAWCLPWSILGLLWILIGGARPIRMDPDGTWHWVAVQGWLHYWFFTRARFGAYTLGSNICYANLVQAQRPDLVAHEKRHVQQGRWFGPFFPFVYLACSAWAWIRTRQAYYLNALEIDARINAFRE